MVDFVEVSSEQFFAKIGPMDVSPHSKPDVTYWETPSRQIIGKSTPGYVPGDAKRWFLARSI